MARGKYSTASMQVKVVGGQTCRDARTQVAGDALATWPWPRSRPSQAWSPLPLQACTRRGPPLRDSLMIDNAYF